MPRRTNTFQEVVAILYRHLAGDGEVEESAMLTNAVTGEEREVDVVIRSEVKGHEMVLGIEATKKKGSSPWVEQMIGKHEELPTDRLVLVSERGFSAPARRYAERKRVALIEPQTLEGPDPAMRLVGRLERMWPKGLAMTPEDLQILVRKPGGELLRVKEVPADGLLFLDDGTPLRTHQEFFANLFEREFPRLAEMIGLNEIDEDRDQAFLLRVGTAEEPLKVPVRGRNRELYLRWELSPEPELHQILQMQYAGRVVINVAEVRLTHQRFDATGVSYGETQLGGRDALLVLTEKDAEEKLTLRVRDEADITAEGSEVRPDGYASLSGQEPDGTSR